MTQVSPVPAGIHAITPQLTIDGCDQAIAWYQSALLAELVTRASDPSGKKVWHAEMRIGDSIFYLNDAFPEMGGPAQPASLWLYAGDVDSRWKRAVDAGAKVVMPLTDMFWGDRSGSLLDPFGIRWNLAQRMRNLTADEMKQAQDEFVAAMAQKK